MEVIMNRFKSFVFLGILIAQTVFYAQEGQFLDETQWVPQFDFPSQITNIDTEFYQKYALPENLLPKIQTHDLDLCYFALGYKQEVLESFPDFSFRVKTKNIVSRVINAHRLKRCIEQHNLDRLSVPEKYVYVTSIGLPVLLAQVVNYTHYSSDDIDSIRDEKTQDSKILNLSSEEVSQLHTFIKETGYHDWHYGNLVRSKDNGKLYIIDTEHSAFLEREFMEHSDFLYSNPDDDFSYNTCVGVFFDVVGWDVQQNAEPLLKKMDQELTNIPEGEVQSFADAMQHLYFDGGWTERIWLQRKDLLPFMMDNNYSLKKIEQISETL